MQSAGRHAAAGTRRRPRTSTRVSSRALLVIGLGLSAGLVGLVLVLGLVAPPRPAPRTDPGTILAGDLSLQVQNSAWITHDDVGGPTPAGLPAGFQMPASMMPGMPDHGAHRLYLEAVLSDIGQADASFGPQEFSVRARDGRTWPLNQPASFTPGSLRPGQQRSLDLLFDMPESVSDVVLTWTHGGELQSISIDAQPPSPHGHG